MKTVHTIQDAVEIAKKGDVVLIKPNDSDLIDRSLIPVDTRKLLGRFLQGFENASKSKKDRQ